METINYHHETKILQGSNVLEQLCDECLSLGDKVLIVFSENRIKQSGLYARVVSLLNICGIDHITYECAGNDYSLDEKKNAIELGRAENVKLVLSIGDEQLMCFTKIVAHDFHHQSLIENVKISHLPIINISTMLNGSRKIDFDFVDYKTQYAQVKPATIFMDFDF